MPTRNPYEIERVRRRDEAVLEATRLTSQTALTEARDACDRIQKEFDQIQAKHDTLESENALLHAEIERLSGKVRRLEDENFAMRERSDP